MHETTDLKTSGKELRKRIERKKLTKSNAIFVGILGSLFLDVRSSCSRSPSPLLFS